jgi:hypothetical protein
VPIEALLVKAVGEISGAPSNEVERAARATQTLLTRCKNKRKHVTSGARTSPGVRKIMDTMQRVSDKTLGQRLAAGVPPAMGHGRNANKSAFVE